jgi:hypothetical protein
MPASVAPTSGASSLEWALYYAARGWSVVPVRRGEKMPAIPWHQFQHRRASDAEIRDWFADPSMGCGIVTGAISNLFVVDFDGEEGAATHARIARQLGIGPTSLTGGGGTHVLFRHPGQRVPTRKALAPGMDIRGDGGFIVAPPSMHASGQPYAWDVDLHPDDIALYDAPGEFVTAICADAPPGPGSAAPVTRAPGPLGLDLGTITDGRETYMRNTVLAVARGLYDRLGRLPTAQEVFDEGWPQYSARVDLSRPGRGEAEFRAKVAYTLHRLSRGAIPSFTAPAASEAPKGEQEAPGGGQEQAKPHQRGIQLLSLDEIEALPPPTWLIRGLVPEQSIVIPYGPPKAGKTFVVLSMALHIAANKPWMGREVSGGGVVYVAGEGVGGLSLRIRAMREAYDIPSNIPFWVVPRAVSFRDPKAVAALVEAIKVTVCDEPISLVVLDTLARAMPGVDENSAEEVGVVIAGCDELKFTLGATIMPIHHAGKDMERGLRGSSAIHGALDASLQITSAEGRVIVKNDNQKDAEAADPFALEMRKVELGLGRSSVVPFLAEGQLPEERRGRGRPRAATAIPVAALDAALAKHSQEAPPHLDLSPSLRVVPEAAWQREILARLPATTGLVGRAAEQEADRRRKQATRLRTAAIAAGEAVSMEGFAWLP